MLRKHWQLSILLTLLVSINSLCPLYCAAFDKMLCGNGTEKIEMMNAESSSPCCHKNKTDTTDGTESSSEDGSTCCLTTLEFILPEVTYTQDDIRQSVEQHLISSLPLATTVSDYQENWLHTPLPPKLSTLSLSCDISPRGPPYTRS